MNLTKLALEQHIETRHLWEMIFQEDTECFLDYYYENVANQNEIYVVKEENQIVSMLHLNPYTVNFVGRLYETRYIVAVATLEKYRKQGLMKSMLEQSLRDMYVNDIPFTFLMPAAEAIYTPYDFATVDHQTHYECMGKIKRNMCTFQNQWHWKEYTFRYASEEECEKLAEFANTKFTNAYRTFTYRTSYYFQRLIKEQVAQNGGIVIVYKGETIVGYFIVANEGYMQVREPVFLNEYEEEMMELLQLQEKDTPKIMIRILNVAACLPRLHFRRGDRMIVHVRDSIITENTGVYQLSPGYGGMRCKKISNEVEEELVISIAELTRRMFLNEPILLNEIV